MAPNDGYDQANSQQDVKQADKPIQKGGKPFMMPSLPKFSNDDKGKQAELDYLLGRLALGYRVLGKLNMVQGVAGHLTIRDPFDRGFWVTPLARPFNLMRKSDLLCIDLQGNVVAGGRPENQQYNRAAFAIHSQIHQAREDAHAAVHSHTTYGKAWSTLGLPLEITTQDSCAFYKSLAVYEGFGGVVIAEEEGRNIAKALGPSNKAVILQNHGLLTVGQTIEAAVAWFTMLEQHCETSLLADTAARARGIKPIVIGDEEAAFTNRLTGSDIAGWLWAKPLFDELEYESHGAHLL